MITLVLLVAMGQVQDQISGFAGRKIQAAIVQTPPPFSGWQATPVGDRYGTDTVVKRTPVEPVEITLPVAKPIVKVEPVKVEPVKAVVPKPEVKPTETVKVAPENIPGLVKPAKAKTPDCDCPECSCAVCMCADKSTWVWSTHEGLVDYRWGKLEGGLYYPSATTPTTPKPPVVQTGYWETGYWETRTYNCSTGRCTRVNVWVP